ncbi:CDP-alcohol phosphatidyltransferase family protein [Demequina sp. NBRC 110052]|uniref:CDP-alcohol phosphatidyltransferase family protein n=1 Tax=Demequina sp. NBRC 110052 TaxID=1570341 RepID=UPI001F3DADB4|nr:CDP-alcohol phosphatidyltransferase family protein [Demequina sp. NBRC 110052]
MEPTRDIWTVPNAISMLRIALIGVFGWTLVIGQDGWAIAALALAGISDFLDGYLARRWNQVTALGRILDPAADRMLTVVVVLGLGIRGIVPWILVAVLLARDVVVGVALVIGRSRGIESPQVTFLGKAATAALYLFLPLAFLAFARWDAVHTLAIVGAWLAAVLYWLAGLGYVRDVARRSDGRAPSVPEPGDA